MNAPAEVIEQAQSQMQGGAGQPAPDDKDAFEVWPENWTTVSTFCRLHAAWHVIGTAAGLHTIGLDPARVRAMLKLLGIKRRKHPELMDALLVMEQAALPLLNAPAG